MLQTVATLVQAAARQVQGQNRFAAIQAQVDTQVRAELVNRRALTRRRTQLVDDGVLDLQSTKVSVVDARAMPAEFNGQGAVRHHVIMPVNVEHAVIQVFGVLHREALKDQQHAVGKA